MAAIKYPEHQNGAGEVGLDCQLTSFVGDGGKKEEDRIARDDISILNITHEALLYMVYISQEGCGLKAGEKLLSEFCPEPLLDAVFSLSIGTRDLANTRARSRRSTV